MRLHTVETPSMDGMRLSFVPCLIHSCQILGRAHRSAVLFSSSITLFSSSDHSFSFLSARRVSAFFLWSPKFFNRVSQSFILIIFQMLVLSQYSAPQILCDNPADTSSKKNKRQYIIQDFRYLLFARVVGIVTFSTLRSASVCHSSLFRDFHHNLRNSFYIGQWLPQHP